MIKLLIIFLFCFVVPNTVFTLERPTLLLFNSKHCGPSKRFLKAVSDPDVAKFLNHHFVVFRYFRSSHNNKFTEFNVDSTPTIIALHNSKEYHRIVGYLDGKDNLKIQFNNLLSTQDQISTISDLFDKVELALKRRDSTFAKSLLFKQSLFITKDQQYYLLSSYFHKVGLSSLSHFYNLLLSNRSEDIEQKLRSLKQLDSHFPQHLKLKLYLRLLDKHKVNRDVLFDFGLFLEANPTFLSQYKNLYLTHFSSADRGGAIYWQLSRIYVSLNSCNLIKDLENADSIHPAYKSVILEEYEKCIQK